MKKKMKMPIPVPKKVEKAQETKIQKIKTEQPAKQMVKTDEKVQQNDAVKKQEIKAVVKKGKPVPEPKKIEVIKKEPIGAPKNIPKKEQPINPTNNTSSKPVIKNQLKTIQKPIKKYKPQINLLKPIQQDKKIVAVIISFKSKATYDDLFTSIKQKAEEGTQVLVYSCSSYDIGVILEGFKIQSEDIVLKEMIQHINSVDADCVVFNWECCSHYRSQKFSEGKTKLFEFLGFILQKGYMAMFSDFSLKALINQWDQKVLGPNPLKIIGETSSHFTLNFNCQVLKNCPSAQLQIIGDMAAEGHCNVKAMGGTIVYGVDTQKSKTDLYKLEVLTVATDVAVVKQPINEIFLCQLNNIKGAAGHIALTYKSGGCLLTSMGHWIELMKINTSEQILFDVAAREYGEESVKNMKEEYEKLDGQAKKQYISENAVKFVQSQAPCKNMSKKAKKGF